MHFIAMRLGFASSIVLIFMSSPQSLFGVELTSLIPLLAGSILGAVAIVILIVIVVKKRKQTGRVNRWKKQLVEVEGGFLIEPAYEHPESVDGERGTAAPITMPVDLSEERRVASVREDEPPAIETDITGRRRRLPSTWPPAEPIDMPVPAAQRIDPTGRRPPIAPAPEIPRASTAERPMASLEVVKGKLQKPFIPISSGNFLIGRANEADLQLLDPKVSRHHARLRYAQGNWYIQDQGSTSGILVNGKAITASLIKPGDNITIANYVFIFHGD